MKIATEGFEGERLREAIEVRSITRTALAEMAGVSAGAISQYVKGTSTPQLSTLQRISNVLGLPVEFFLSKPPAPPELVFWRSFSSTTEAARRKSRWQLNWSYSAVQFLDQYVEFPILNLPDFDIPENLRELTPDRIEEIALAVRRHWRLGMAPISNMVWLLENNGVFVRRNTVYDNNLDAFSCRFPDTGQAAVFLAADKSSACRSRFDAAHELGHLLLHKNVDPSVLKLRSELNLIEDQAHRFAGAFLLPATSFYGDLRSLTLDDFLRLKPKWKVSVRAMIMRARQLGYCSADEAKWLFIAANRRWGAKREDLDDQISPESPTLIRSALQALVDDEIITKHDVMSALPYGRIDLGYLFGVDENFFCEQPPEVRVLPARVVDI